MAKQEGRKLPNPIYDPEIEASESYAIQLDALAEEMKSELLLRGFLRGDSTSNLAAVAEENADAIGPLLLKLKVARGDIGKTLDVAHEILTALDGWVESYASTCAEMTLQRQRDRANGVNYGNAA